MLQVKKRRLSWDFHWVRSLFFLVWVHLWIWLAHIMHINMLQHVCEHICSVNAWVTGPMNGVPCAREHHHSALAFAVSCGYYRCTNLEAGYWIWYVVFEVHRVLKWVCGLMIACGKAVLVGSQCCGGCCQTLTLTKRSHTHLQTHTPCRGT